MVCATHLVVLGVSEELSGVLTGKNTSLEGQQVSSLVKPGTDVLKSCSGSMVERRS